MLAYEGEALLGHWLPRALADLSALMAGLGGQKTIRIDWLRAWGLPHAAATDEADEDAERTKRNGGLADIAAWVETDGD